MKLHALPAWILLILAGSLFTCPPSPAQSAGPALTAVPKCFGAHAQSGPIGSEIWVSWQGIHHALGYRVYRDGAFLTDSAGNVWTDYAVAGGETHSYAVSSLGLAGESAQSAPVTATVPIGGGQVIYADVLENAWQPWGWAALNFANTAPVRKGCSVQVTPGPWEAMYLHHDAFDTTPYKSLSFWINGGQTGGQSLQVVALRDGVPQTPVPLPPLPTGQWRHVILPLSSLGVAAVPDMDGFWIQDSTGTVQPSFFVDEICLIAALSVLVAPASPADLAAAPQWAASCPVCGGMAMPHVVLTWDAVSGATAYTVYRDGASVATHLSSPGWTDMSVTSGQAYAYAVSATGPGGEGARSAPVSTIAPNPPAASGPLTAPTNLSVQGTWLGAPADILSWSPSAGAASYNVYQYGVPIAQGVTATTFTVPTTVFCGGLTYSVTAMDSMGMETLPSAIVTAQGQSDPSEQPSWMQSAPQPPTQVAAVAEWNVGAARIHLTWQGCDTSSTYNVYRDGTKVGGGLWGLNFYDNAVQPGETHTYTVSGVNLPWTISLESAQSSPVTVMALSSLPAPTGTSVQITNVQANDDSVVVSFAPVPGAVDYRVYNIAKPNSVKYSGGGLSIEMNGLDPAGATLVVEAVDKLGSFQTMDGMAGPGAMQMDGMHVAINGQGDPSDVPNVLAASAPFPVTLQPITLTGSQVFFDTFRNEPPLTPQPLPAVVQGDFYGVANQYAEYANDQWDIRNYGGDITNSAVFFMGNHFMDTLYDGGTPHTSDPLHNNNASLVMMPKSTADISGGKVLHVTCEVDGHFDGRRWCDIQIGAAGDLLTCPGKVEPGDGTILPATVSGNSLRWQIKNDFHHLILYQNAGTPQQPAMTGTELINVDWSTGGLERQGPAARIRWDGVPLNNGTAQDLDKRHRFDLYVSQTHYRLLENGQTIKDADFPVGHGLPFAQCQVYFVHQIYHTDNDRHELIDGDPADPYWYNYRPWCDERHWDNCGFSVLDAFPSLP